MALTIVATDVRLQPGIELSYDEANHHVDMVVFYQMEDTTGTAFGALTRFIVPLNQGQQMQLLNLIENTVIGAIKDSIGM